jgi:hypothetical protein
MRALVALVMIASMAGCLRTTEFRCTTDTDCSASDGVCEPTGYCSFGDTSCAMGRRYGEFSGSYSKQCVGDQMMVDGGTDGSGSGDGGGGGCPSTYATLPNAGTHVYKLTANATLWSTQRDRCAADGAYLAIPDNTAELQAVTTAAAAQRTWIGISDTATEGTFVTVKNTPATFLPWSTSPVMEPDDAMGGQDCVSALMAMPLIQTDKCSDTLPAVCECEP